MWAAVLAYLAARGTARAVAAPFRRGPANNDADLLGGLIVFALLLLAMFVVAIVFAGYWSFLAGRALYRWVTR